MRVRHGAWYVCTCRCLQLKDVDNEGDAHGAELWQCLLNKIQLELTTLYDERYTTQCCMLSALARHTHACCAALRCLLSALARHMHDCCAASSAHHRPMV